MDQKSSITRTLWRRLPIAIALSLALVFTILPGIALAGPLGDLTAPITVSDLDASYPGEAVILLTATDLPGIETTVTGIASITYRLDDGMPVTVSTPTTGTAPASTTVRVSSYGDHTLQFWATDNDGNVGAPVPTLPAVFSVGDDVAPLTVSDREAVYLDTAVITLSAIDQIGGSGVEATYYSLDGAAAVAGTIITVNTPGDHTLSFWSEDVAGNIETPVVTAFEVWDTLAPITTSDVKAAYIGAATITLSVSDASGVTETWYILDDGAAVKGTSVTVSTLGDHTLKFWSVDLDGNAEAMQTVNFSIALSADPTAPVSTSDAVPTYATSPATIKLTTTEEAGGSGIKSLSYKVDGGTTVVVLPPAGPPAPGTLANPITPTIPAAASHHTLGTCTDCHTGGCAECHGVGPAPDLTTADPKPASHAFITVTPCTACHVVNPASTPMSIMKDVVVSGLGAHTIEFWGEDVAGNIETPHKMVNFTIGEPASELDVVAVAGVSRIGTAIEASKLAFPEGATYVVIATAYNWPDALGGSALAGALNAPILLTPAGSLPAEVAAEITRLDAEYAVILGGTGAVSDGVETSLEALLGDENVDRIGGLSRYDTAKLIAQATIDVLDEGYDGTAFIATGANFPDALGASPLAAANGWPIYLANPTQGNNAALVAIMEDDGVTDAILLGGTGVVADSIRLALGDTYETRLAGLDRYATAVAVATYGVSDAGLYWDKLAIATGENFPDALAGGVLQANSGSVMLLTHTAYLDTVVAAKLTSEASSIFEVRFLGGTGAVSTAVRASVTNILEK